MTGDLDASHANPLVPPCTSKLSPSVSRPSHMMLFQAVKKTSGSEAASMKVNPFGIATHCAAGTKQ